MPSDTKPFESIESAQEFMALLMEAVVEARASAEEDLAESIDPDSSRAKDALRLVLYKVSKLEQHVGSSRRLLNDLRMLRRLMLAERSSSSSTPAQKN